jgi:hypothetical protein
MLPTDLHQELQELAAELIGWIPLGEGVYLHVADEKATEIGSGWLGPFGYAVF